jgi:hypothetical protein
MSTKTHLTDKSTDTNVNAKKPSFKITNSNNHAENRLGYYRHMQSFSAYVNKVKQEISKELS